MLSDEFKKLVHRSFALLPVDILLAAWSDTPRLREQTGVDVLLTRFESIDGDFYFPIDYLERVQRQYSTATVAFLQSFVDRGVVQGEELKTFARQLAVADDQTALIGQFQQTTEALENLLVFLLPTHPLAEVVRLRVRAIVERHDVNEAELDATVSALAIPSRLDGMALERRALDALRDHASTLSPAALDVALQTHTDHYGYLGYREPFAAGYSIEFFRERLEQSDQESSAHLDSPPRIQFTSEERAEVKLLREFVFFRTYRTEKLYEALFFLEPLWRALARSFGLTDETNLCWYRLEEVRRLFGMGERVNDGALADRQAGFGLSFSDGQISLLTGSALAARHAELEPPIERTEELRGTSASPGIIHGKVRIVRTAADHGKVERGDVLVSSMTTPNFLPAMERAGAFVTDEGGITCHAAIVAREMGKPCVIGTKIATQVFKDGDLVEVDATNGVVRKVD